MRNAYRTAVRLMVIGVTLYGGTALGATPEQKPDPKAIWKPDRNVEFMMPLTAGSALDRAGRLIQKIAQDKRYIETTSTVVNKSGGGGSIGWVYLNSHPGDGHYIGIATPSVLTNHIIGQAAFSHADFTPVAVLMTEHVAFAVRTESTIRNGADLVGRLKQDPASVSFAFAPAMGNQFHIAAAQLIKSAGLDPRRMKAVVFPGAGEALAATLGGHVDVMITAASNMVSQTKSGKMRVLGLASTQRAPGALADIPTWKEQGMDVVSPQWRGMLAPRGLNAAQLAFWDSVLEKITRSEEWQKDLEANLASDSFLPSGKARAYMDAQYQDFRGLLGDVGLAKR